MRPQCNGIINDIEFDISQLRDELHLMDKLYRESCSISNGEVRFNMKAKCNQLYNKITNLEYQLDKLNNYEK